MKTIDSDQIIQNLQKIRDKYQEIVLYLLQGKGVFVPPSLVNEDKNRLMFTSVSEQLWKNHVYQEKLLIACHIKFRLQKI